MGCLRLPALNLLVFAIVLLFSSCANFFVDPNSTTTSSVPNGSGTTPNNTGGTSTGVPTGSGTFSPTGGTGTTGTTGMVGTTTPPTGGTGTTGTGTTGVGTTGTGPFGTVTTGTGTGTFGTVTTGTGSGTGTTGVGGFFASTNTRINAGKSGQSAFLFGAIGRTVVATRIDPASGRLSETRDGAAVETGIQLDAPISSIASDPNGRFLFVSTKPGASVSNENRGGAMEVLVLDHSNARLSGVPNGSVGQGGEDISVDPAGRFLYTATDGGIAVYSIDQSSGRLTGIPGSPFGNDVGHLAVVSPDGKFLFVIGDKKASTFSLDPITGIPTAVGAPIATDAQSESGVAVAPNGHFLFIVDATSTVKVIGIDANGKLTPLSPSPDTRGRNLSIAAHPNSEFLYIATSSDSAGGGNVQAFHVDASGNMTAISNSAGGAGVRAVQIALNASGKFLYASTSKGVITLSIDQNTGALDESSLDTASVSTSEVIAVGP